MPAPLDGFDPNLAAALRLAAAGLAVFPCKSDKSPWVKWRDQSTTDPETIRSWWITWPNSLPAIDLAKCGLIVIDLDRHKGGSDGAARFWEIAQAHGDALANVPMIMTAGDGVHAYFRQPQHALLGNREGLLRGQGINVRGHGGYAIGLGAVRPTGGKWQQIDNTPDFFMSLADGTIPEIPNWLRTLITEDNQPFGPLGSAPTATVDDNARDRQYARAVLKGEAETVATATVGNRNNSLNSAAFRLGTLIPTGGIDRLEVEATLEQAALHAGLEPGETTRTIKSGIEGGMANPRQSVIERDATVRAGVTILGVNGGHTPDLSTPAWPEPKPLPSGLSPVAPFDPAFLPTDIAGWVLDIAERMQCPPDFVAVSAVVALGSVIGRQIGIRPKLKDDWTVTPNLWGMIVGRPGVMKSPAMTEALAPLKRLEAKAREEHQAKLQAHQAAVQVYELQIAAAKSHAKTQLKSDITATGSIQLPQEPTPPRPKRFIASDSTYEALAEILVHNPRGVLAYRDELIALLKTLGREENSDARGFFMTGWNGSDSYVVDRIIRGHQYIEAVCLSMLGSTQPGRLTNYIGHALRGGEGDDGMIQRFGLLVWPDQSTDWRYVDQFPDSPARDAAFRRFERLSDLHEAGLQSKIDPWGRGPYLDFEPEAAALFAAWLTDLERRLRSGELHVAVESHFSKYRKLVPALALINHLADGGIGAVPAAALKRAIGFARYLETHAHRAYGSGLRMEVVTAQAIVARIRKGEIAVSFTLRDIHQRNWSTLTDRDQVQAGLDLLVDLDWLVSETVRTGGRPKTIYHINPRAMA
jgi:hypothetical protein